MILLSCPFCGSEPNLIEGVLNRGSNTKGTAPAGATIVKVKQANSRWSRTRYYWERKGYAVRCITPNCYCSKSSALFFEKEEAINKWNTRVKN